MARYIEFTTSAHDPHIRFSHGNPVHDGKVPSRYLSIAGVRIDGEPVHFADESLPDRLHRALQSSRLPWRKGALFTCVTFACRMYDIPMANPRHNPLRQTDVAAK